MQTRRFTSRQSTVALLAAVFFLLLNPSAQAADEAEKAATDSAKEAPAIRVIQQRPVIKAGRFEVQLLGEASIADVMFRHLSVGTNMYYHLSEEWALGGAYRHYFSEESSLLGDVTDKFEVFPERAVMRWSAGLDATWTPIYGKLAFFDDQIVHFDMHLIVGAGVTQTSRTSTPHVMGTVGLGGRLLISSWFSMNLEVRDQIYVESYNDASQLVNNVGLNLGFSIFFPFDHDYRFPK